MPKKCTISDLPVPPRDEGWPWTEASEPLPETMPDGEPWPKVSVVTPSYNQATFLEETIRSVLLQGYPNLEYIVIDGGSADGSVVIIEKYAPWLDYWESEPDRGQSHAINKGFELATGEIYAWLNSDDTYLPDALAHVARCFVEQPDADVFVGKSKKIRESGEVVYTADVPDLTFESFLRWRYPNGRRHNFLQPACFFSRHAWETCGPLREDLRYSMDVDLWLRMVKRFQFAPVEHLLALAKAHDRAKTTGETERTAVEVSLLIAEHGGQDIARRMLMEMADELSELRKRAHIITKHPAYKIISPVYRFFRSLFSRNEVTSKRS